MRRFASVCSSASAALAHQMRGIVQRVDAATFESEVLQSQQAICLVYHIPNSACGAYLQQVDKLSDEANNACSASWLKTCSVDGDQNKNLASAFSVERAKLPVTFFVMHGTIVDKVNGAISDDRLRSIFDKFKGYYENQTGVDLTAGMGASADSIPIRSAPQSSLTDGASTQVLINKLVDSLVGVNCIMLPKEMEQMDGLKKSLQHTKKQSYKELADLHKSLGMDQKRLSEEDLTKKYYKSTQLMCAALSSALEALFLARIYAYVGRLAERNVTEAVTAISNDFRQTMGDNNMKRLMSVVDINLTRGYCREKLGGTLPAWAMNGGMGVASDEDTLLPMTAETRQLDPIAQDDKASEAFFHQVLKWCDVADGRIPPNEFPSEDVEDMFAMMKQMPSSLRRDEEVRRRFNCIKSCLVGVVQLFPDDQQSRAARSRLTSLVY